MKVTYPPLWLIRAVLVLATAVTLVCAGVFLWSLGYDSFAPWLMLIVSAMLIAALSGHTPRHTVDVALPLSLLLVAWLTIQRGDGNTDIDWIILVGTWLLILGGLLLRLSTRFLRK